MVTAARYKGYVVEMLRTYYPLWRAQKEHALSIDPYIKGIHPLPIASASQSQEEQEALRRIAQTPYGKLIIDSAVQAIKVVGLRSAEDDEMPEIYRNLWVKNRMKARQAGIVRAAVGYGVSYSSILPGETGYDGLRNTFARGKLLAPTRVETTHTGSVDDLNPVTGSSDVVWKTYNPKTMTAFFAETHDHFPEVALNGIEQVDTQGKYLLFEIFDDEAVHYATVREHDTQPVERMKVEYIESRPHNSPVTPIVAHSPIMDGDDGSQGELVPFLPILHRIDQTIYDRLLIQRQAAWSVRWATGVEKPKDPTQVQAMRSGDLLTSPKVETKFGQLDPSPMGDHNAVHDSDLRDLSSVSQTPSYMIEGLDGSMQPEALAAITSGYYAKIEGYQDAIGESYEQAFRLASAISPGIGDVSDFAEVRWKGFRPYSLTQVADALGKLADQLQIPVEMLFEQVPFFTDEDVKRATRGREEAQEKELEEQMALAKEQAAPAPGQPGQGGGRQAYSAGRPKSTPGGNSAAQNKR